VEEVIDYILDYIFPRQTKIDLEGYSNQEIKLDNAKDFNNSKFSKQHLFTKYILGQSIHNYFEGAVWNCGVIWNILNLDSKQTWYTPEKLNGYSNFGLTKCDNYIVNFPIIYTGLYENNLMKKLIYSAKFNGEWAIAKQIGKQIGIFLYSLLEQGLFLLSNQVVITYIPPDKIRHNQRGFHLPKIIANQAFKEINKNNPSNKNITRQIFQNINTNQNFNYSNLENSNFHIIELLQKNKSTQRQTKLTKTERQINIKNTFQINTKTIQKISFLNKNNQINSLNNSYTVDSSKLEKFEFQIKTETITVVVVDDVTTTGATLNEACLVLYKYLISIGYNKNKIKVIGMCWLYAE
jgi:predicted amidophosphoribosyltransferase